jgi:ectoine hydroxylase-related dioxygenase (phytanoyl-CoA dioxygenase family)
MFLNPDCCWGGLQEANRYVDAQHARRQDYEHTESDEYSEVAEHANTYGYSKIENFIDTSRLQRIIESFNSIKEQGLLQYDDFYTEQVAHPLATCDGVFDLTFDDELIKIATSFFGCLPVITNAQLRKSKATSLSENQLPGNGQTTLFHCDKDSPRFLKFFFYLTDVNYENGPFTYVHQSHIQKFEGWKLRYRWSEDDIRNIYGPDRIIRIGGKVGDLVMANTNGFHKGSKVLEGDRLLLTIYYSIHPTQWLDKWGGKIRQEDFDLLPSWKKPLADYLNKETQ